MDMTNLPVLKLRDLIAAEGSQRAAAAKLGVSAAYLGDVLRGKREAGPAICEALGISRTVTVTRTVEYR